MQGPALATPRGAVEKKMTKVTYIVHLPQSQKQSSYSYSLCFIFIFIFTFCRFFLKAFLGRFVTRRVQKHKKVFFEKKHLGSSQKMRLFSPPFLSPLFRLFCSVFVVTRVWSFRNKGSSKTRLKKNARKSPQPPKKVVTYVTFFFFPRPPLATHNLQLTSLPGTRHKARGGGGRKKR
jgi:hypothetical protein